MDTLQILLIHLPILFSKLIRVENEMIPLSQAAENFAAICGLLGFFLAFHSSMSSQNVWIIN